MSEAKSYAISKRRREKYFAESKRVVAALAGVNADLERTATEELSKACDKLARGKEKD